MALECQRGPAATRSSKLGKKEAGKSDDGNRRHDPQSKALDTHSPPPTYPHRQDSLSSSRECDAYRRERIFHHGLCPLKRTTICPEFGGMVLPVDNCA